MSPLVLLGLLGTVLSTVFMFPHLATALRDKRPSGTTFAWALTASQSATWMSYGLVGRDWLVAAPGFVTVPIALSLAVWAYLATRRTPHTATATGGYVPGQPGPALPEVAELEQMFAAAPARVRDRDFGDTLELPKIAA